MARISFEFPDVDADGVSLFDSEMDRRHAMAQASRVMEAAGELRAALTALTMEAETNGWDMGDGARYVAVKRARDLLQRLEG